MENKTIPSIVKEEVQHHQKVEKVEEAYQHTLDVMNGYLTNHTNNELPNNNGNNHVQNDQNLH